MNLDPQVRIEWSERRLLSYQSLQWITDHAEEADPHPTMTAIDQLRREQAP